MSFKIIKDLSPANLPGGSALTSGVDPAKLYQVVIEAAPNLDASGGAMSITSTVGADGTPVTSLTYTDAAGAMVSVPFDLPEGMTLVQDEAIVFGEALDRFVVLAGEFTPVGTNNILSEFSLIEVQLDASGTPSVAGVQSLFEGFRAHFVELEAGIYALGDGRLGYAYGDGSSDFGVSFGVVTDKDGTPVVDRLGGGAPQNGALIALDEGGLLLVEQSPGGSSYADFELKQFSVTGNVIGYEYIDIERTLEDQSIDFESAAVSLVVTDTGDLEVFISSAR